MKKVSLYILSICLLCLISCTTQQKCIEKFPPKEIATKSDTVVINKIVYMSGEADVPEAEAELTMDKNNIKDTIVETDRVKIQVKNEPKTNNVNIQCQCKEFKLKIDSLEMVIQEATITNTTLQQVYFDQKAENKRIKDSLKYEVKLSRANQRPATQEAKAAKWKWIALSIGGLIFLALLIFYVPKRRSS